MLNAPIPDNETARLAAVRATGLLGTEADAGFDRYTRLAAHLFQVPVALVSLVDETRVWYQSRFGFGPHETPRLVSFCSHAIAGEGVFLVEDAAADERFADNPLVTGQPGIRFYCGYPLISPHGYRLGALCAMDTRSRQFSDRAGEALRDIAEMVSAEIVSRQFAAVDPMTGLPNRRGFADIAEFALAMCRRQSSDAALVTLQLDGVDVFDDACVDASDSHALERFGALLRNAVRDSDVTARLVDNKFALLLTDATMEQAWQCVERLRSLAADQNRGSDHDRDTSFCAGVALYDPDRHKSVEQLMAEGDQMLYRQKRARPPRSLAVRSG